MQLTSKPTVLIVDDAPDNLMLINMLLQGRCVVRQADSGAAALRLAHTQPLPDLILLDVLMPDMDGYAVCSALHADAQLAEIPVIFLTSRNQEEDQRRGFMAGAVDYITKPINPDVLQARVATHLQLSQLRALFRQQQQALQDLLGPASALLDGRAAPPAAHVQRVQHHAAALARQLQAMHKARLSEQEIALLFDAIALLECGNLQLPATLPVQLPGIDRAAQDLLQLTISLHTLRAAHFDGSGSPPLQGNALPLPVRIWHVAHVLEHLLGNRDYKPALALEPALAVLQRERGRHFDPDLVDAACAIREQLQAIAQRSAPATDALCEAAA